MFGLFKKHPAQTKRAVIFVDYEHWFISFEKLYQKKPDIKAFRDELAQSYEIVDISFFADFSHPSLRAEISRIRAVTGSIIETQNASSHYKKDFTDFIMLDHIYQEALMRSNIDTFIIFSGDGHFSSVVSFLKTKCRKEVGIYGVKGAISQTLRNAADWAIEVSGVDQEFLERAKMILGNLKALQDARGKKKVRITFWATAEAVAKSYGVDKNEIADALRKLLEKGYLSQRYIRSGTKSVKVIDIDWDKCKKDGLC